MKSNRCCCGSVIKLVEIKPDQEIHRVVGRIRSAARIEKCEAGTANQNRKAEEQYTSRWTRF